MKRSPKSWFCSPRAVVALVAALAGAACSDGPERTLGDAGLLRAGGVTASLHADPLCHFTDLNSGVTPNNSFGTDEAALVQLRSTRARFEMIGDAGHSIGEPLGACAAPPPDATGADVPPTVIFRRGHATVTQVANADGTRKVVLDAEFGELLFPGNAAEPGVVVANDINAGGRNVLEIIWPGLAGTGAPGSLPIVRVQMSSPPRDWSATAPYTVQIDWNMDAVATDDESHVMHLAGTVAGIPLDGSTIRPGGPSVTPACPVLEGGTVRVDLAGLVQNKNTRLRFEVVGDADPNHRQVRDLGSCAATDAPTVEFTGGDATITVTSGGVTYPVSRGTLQFGPLLFPGATVEPGVVVANNIGGRSVLEIIWPDLAGGPAGSPVFRVQLDQADFQNRNRLSRRAVVHYVAHFTARQWDPKLSTPDWGQPKTFTVIADFTL